MTVQLALAKLYDDVVALFASDSTTIAAPIYTFVGTSVPTVHSTSVPLGNFDIRVKITTGGTVGIAGVFLEYSLDGGATWSSPVALGTATSYLVPTTGVTIDFSAGTLEVDDAVKVVVTKTDPVVQAFGWRQRAQRTGKTARIVWVPGDDEKGDIGKILPARNPGRNPRPVGTVEELFTVYIESQDSTAAEDERAQYVSARLLFDGWFRAVHLVAHGTYQVQSAEWVNPDLKERRFGATIRVLCTVQAMIPDAPVATTPVDTRAVLTDSLLDVDETNDTSNI